MNGLTDGESQDSYRVITAGPVFGIRKVEDETNHSSVYVQDDLFIGLRNGDSVRDPRSIRKEYYV